MGLSAVGGGVKPGTIASFGGALPGGYLACDGSNVSRAAYAALFAAIATNFGVGDGSTTFGLPDCRRRTLVGSGGAGTGTLGAALGNSGGEEAHVQSSAELANHLHTQNESGSPGVGANYAYGQGSGSLQGTYTIGSAGSSAAANVMQPSLVVLRMIKY